MKKTDAEKVKQELKDGNPVVMEMSWTTKEKDHVVYELYTVPTDFASRDFLHGFGNVAVALGNKATFVPHMYVYDGAKSHCQGDSGENFCFNLCTNGGRYCETDPDNDLEKGTSGADVVAESLRRLCIWKQYGETDGIGKPWWDYVAEFDKECSVAGKFNDTACIQEAYDHAGVDKNKIDACMEDSGGLTNDAANALLDLEIAAATSNGVVVLPTLLVQTTAVRGQLSTQNAFFAICAAFTEGTKPSICNECSDCGSSFDGCIANERCAPPKPHVPAEKPSVENSYDDASTNDPFEDMLSSETVMEFLGGLGDCGIDMEEIMGTAAGLGGENPDMQDLSSLAEMDLLKESPACSDAEKDRMSEAFESFNACTGYDMLELEELWPSALVGVIQKCAKSLMEVAISTNVTDLANADFELDDVPKECSSALLGNNPLGTAIRRLLLHPDETLPCFQAVSEELPRCSLNLWPIGIDGGLLKLGSCMIGKTTPLWEGFCNITLTGFDECLPKKGAFVESDCETVAHSCANTSEGALGAFFDLPKSLMGLPLPDTCVRLSSVNPKGAVVDRYDEFRSTCTAGSPLWTAWENGDVESAQLYLETMTSGPSQSLDSSEGRQNSTGSSIISFFSGLVTGMCAVGLAVAVVMVRKRQVNKKGAAAETANAKYSPVVPDEGEMA